jgi:hypothetical protein
MQTLNEQKPFNKCGRFDRSPPISCKEYEITLNVENRSHEKKYCRKCYDMQDSSRQRTPFGPLPSYKDIPRLPLP